MEWCGWTTSAFEKDHAECVCIWSECKGVKSRGVKLENVQTDVFNHMRRAQATWVTPVCRTLTRVSIPIPGQRHPPKSLRSAEDLWGKPRLKPSSGSNDVQQTQDNEPLSAAERSLLLEHNDLITFVVEALEIIHEANKDAEVRQLGTAEYPRKSWLWCFDFLQMGQWCLNTADDEAWTVVEYLACLSGGVRTKKQRSRANMRSARQTLHVEGMARVQCYDHHLQELEPWNANLGEWGAPGQAEREYPTEFAWQPIVAISCGTVKRFHFSLSVASSAALQPLVGGDRWTTLPANTVSELMMVPSELQWMLCPSKGEEHIPPVICAPVLQQLLEGAV